MPRPSSGVTFQDSWTQDPLFKDWLRCSNDKSNKSEAFCIFCRKNIDCKVMGRSALVSHMKGKKHLALVSAKADSHMKGMLNFIKPASCKTKVVSESDSESKDNHAVVDTVIDSKKASHSVADFVAKDETLVSEIWWCLHTALKNHSASSNKDIDFYLKKMFPSDPRVQKFSCGETKTTYMMVFGIAPHFKSELLGQISGGPYSLMFDESLNRSLGKKQLDIHVRFWCDGLVKTRYVTSKMLGHATANDLLDALNSVKGEIPFDNLVHLAMDGPNVNWSLYEKLSEQIHIDHQKKLCNIGSCGLHQMHNALRKGFEVTEWDLPHVLSSVFYLFKDVPARRDDYTTVTDSTVFPLKYCAHRWVENQKVVCRLKEMLPHLKKYVRAVQQKKCPDPATKSFSVVKSFVEDPLAECKLAFSLSVCKPVEKFLTQYQTEVPMIPFLYTDLLDVINSLAKRVVKPDALKSDVRDLKPTNSEILLDYTKVNLGVETTELLKQSKCSPKDLMCFRMKCREALTTTVAQMLKKSPVIYSLCKYLQFLNPETIVKRSDSAVKYLKSALLTVKHCQLDDMDDLISEFEAFIVVAKSKDKFLNYRAPERVDSLFFEEMSNEEKFKGVWDFVKKCLVISHGQAAVERGFSENKEVLETNMKEDTLIARRMIKDYVRAAGGIEKISLSSKLNHSCSLAHRRYMTYLEEKRVGESKSRKRQMMEEEVLNLKKRKVDLEDNVRFLNKESDKQCDKAESVVGMKEQVSLFTSANALRKSAKLKEAEVSKINEELKEKEALLKTL